MLRHMSPQTRRSLNGKHISSGRLSPVFPTIHKGCANAALCNTHRSQCVRQGNRLRWKANSIGCQWWQPISTVKIIRKTRRLAPGLTASAGRNSSLFCNDRRVDGAELVGEPGAEDVVGQIVLQAGRSSY